MIATKVHIRAVCGHTGKRGPVTTGRPRALVVRRASYEEKDFKAAEEKLDAFHAVAKVAKKALKIRYYMLSEAEKEMEAKAKENVRKFVEKEAELIEGAAHNIREKVHHEEEQAEALKSMSDEATASETGSESAELDCECPPGRLPSGGEQDRRCQDLAAGEVCGNKSGLARARTGPVLGLRQRPWSLNLVRLNAQQGDGPKLEDIPSDDELGSPQVLEAAGEDILAAARRRVKERAERAEAAAAMAEEAGARFTEFEAGGTEIEWAEREDEEKA
ncbi:unnamed protein product [Pedinophyceae sp. YPF-701]|nr:unnamed protein product [Pedinophyceae sp. YPF-701]